jgi:hypothetical protein
MILDFGFWILDLFNELGELADKETRNE